jgi:methyl-accepting chemotaxis protein
MEQGNGTVTPEALTTLLVQLNGRVDEIIDILVIMREVIDQTGLLILDGTAVADALEGYTTKALTLSPELSEKLRRLQSELSDAVGTMGKGATGLAEMARYVERIGTILDDLADKSQRVRILSTAMTGEEGAGSLSPVSAVQGLEEITVLSHAMSTQADEVFHTVILLLQMMEQLRSSLGSSKAKGTSIMFDLAKVDHKIFVSKIALCMRGSMTLDPSQLPDHRSCRFGRWYLGEGKHACGTLPSFQALQGVHEQFHALAKKTASAYSAGAKSEAEQTYREMGALSDRLQTLLDVLKRESS